MQRLHIQVLRSTDNLPTRKPIPDLYVAFHILYVCDFIAKLCSHKAQDIQNREHSNIRNTGQSEAQERKCERLKIGIGVQAYARGTCRYSETMEDTQDMICFTKPVLT